MKKIQVLVLSLGLLAAPLFAKAKKGSVVVTLRNQSNIPITAIKISSRCFKRIRGEFPACHSKNISAGQQTNLSGSGPFKIAIHHQQPGQKMRFVTKRQVKKSETLVFPSDSFKILKGKFPARVRPVQPVPAPKPTIVKETPIKYPICTGVTCPKEPKKPSKELAEERARDMYLPGIPLAPPVIDLSKPQKPVPPTAEQQEERPECMICMEEQGLEKLSCPVGKHPQYIHPGCKKLLKECPMCRVSFKAEKVEPASAIPLAPPLMPTETKKPATKELPTSLQDEIKKGATLTPVKKTITRPRPTGKESLLEEIRTGKKLRPTPKRKKQLGKEQQFQKDIAARREQLKQMTPAERAKEQKAKEEHRRAGMTQREKMMEQIEEGRKLKPAPKATIPPAPPVMPTATKKPAIKPAAITAEKRAALLEQIRADRKLKTIPAAERAALEQRRKEARTPDIQKAFERGRSGMRLPEVEATEEVEGVWKNN